MTLRAVNCFVSTKVRRILNVVVSKKYSNSALIDAAQTDSSIVAGVKKLKREPFALNLFLGKFDHEVLAFPEVLGPEKLEQLNEIVAPVERFFEEEGMAVYCNLNIFMLNANYHNFMIVWSCSR